MYLYEEYAKRFSIQCPIFKRTDKLIVFLDKEIILVEKKSNFNQPQSYQVSICEPEKSNSRSISFFKSISKNDVALSEYDEYMLDFCKKTNSAIEDPNQVYLRFWEIFVIYNNYYFSNNISYNFLYATIDLDNEHRIKDIQEFISFLKNNNIHYYHRWLQMSDNIINYSYSLANSINVL